MGFKKQIAIILIFFLSIVAFAETTTTLDKLKIRPTTLPTAGATGDIRHNTSTNIVEFYDGNNWAIMGGSDFKASTSGTGTPTGDSFVDDGEGLTGNEIALTAGSWLVTCIAQYSSSGGDPLYTTLQTYISSTEDAATSPTGLEAGHFTGFLRVVSATMETVRQIVGPARITTTTTATIYCNPAVTATTHATSRVTVFMYGERVE